MNALPKVELVWMWREKVTLEARKAGLQQGLQVGRQEMLFNLLRGKFGSLPESMVSYLQGVADPAVLDEISLQLLTAVSLEDIMVPE